MYWNVARFEYKYMFMSGHFHVAYSAYEKHTFNATPTERFQQHPLVFAMNRTYCTFFLWRLHLAPPSHPSQSTTLLWLERPSSKCANLPTVALSNTEDHTSWSIYFCWFAPHGCCSSRTSRSWWIAHSKQCWLRGCNTCTKVGLDFLKWLIVKETSKMHT